MFVCVVVQYHNVTCICACIHWGTGNNQDTKVYLIFLDDVNLQHCVSNLLSEYRWLKLKVKYPIHANLGELYHEAILYLYTVYHSCMYHI